MRTAVVSIIVSIIVSIVVVVHSRELPSSVGIKFDVLPPNSLFRTLTLRVSSLLDGTLGTKSPSGTYVASRTDAAGASRVHRAQ